MEKEKELQPGLPEKSQKPSTVYITSSARETAWEVYPEETDYDDRLTGEEAKKVLTGADYKGVHCTEYSTDKNGNLLIRGECYYFTETATGEWFKVSIRGSRGRVIGEKERYGYLVKRLEERARNTIGKSGGLVIVIS